MTSVRTGLIECTIHIKVKFKWTRGYTLREDEKILVETESYVVSEGPGSSLKFKGSNLEMSLLIEGQLDPADSAPLFSSDSAPLFSSSTQMFIL